MTNRIVQPALLAVTLASAGVACSTNNAQTSGPADEMKTASTEGTASAPSSAPAAAPTSAPASAPSAKLPMPPARGDDAERKSKNGRLQTEIGGVPVLVQYGRPEARGRDLFGSLIPYGKIWRTGADEATTLSLMRNATIEGKPVAAGTYALFTIPTKDKWTIVINRTAEQWGAYNYDPEQDVVRVEVSPMAKAHTEALTFEAQGSALVLKWGTVAVPIQIKSAG